LPQYPGDFAPLVLHGSFHFEMELLVARAYMSSAGHAVRMVRSDADASRWRLRLILWLLSAALPVRSYTWLAAPFPSCPTVQNRSFACVHDSGTAVANETLCSANNGTRPVEQRTCNATGSCPLTGLCDSCVDDNAAAVSTYGTDCAGAWAAIWAPGGHTCYDDAVGSGPLAGICPALCESCDGSSSLESGAGILVHATTSIFSAVAPSYANDANCIRVLQAPAGKRVRLPSQGSIQRWPARGVLKRYVRVDCVSGAPYLRVLQYGRS
jgi:hypothetical protein